MNQTFHFHIELSKKCALKCPRCPRTEAPDMYDPTELDLTFIKNSFPAEVIENMQRLLICGGEGDPIYCRDFLKIVRYFKQVRPELAIYIVSNGSYKKAEWWEELASILNTYDRFIFSIDGWNQASNEKYRVNCDWESILDGIDAMKGHDFLMVWSTIIFRFNESKIERIRALATELGFDYFMTVKSQLFGSKNAKYLDPELGIDPLEPVLGQQSNSTFHLRDAESISDRLKNKPLFRTLYQNRLKDIEKDYRENEMIPLCKAGERGLYVSADGLLYPCSWVSHPFKDKLTSSSREGMVEAWEDMYFTRHRRDWDLRQKTLDEIMTCKSWLEMDRLWRTKSETPVICELKCHANVCEKRDLHPVKTWSSEKEMTT